MQNTADESCIRVFKRKKTNITVETHTRTKSYDTTTGKRARKKYRDWLNEKAECQQANAQ